MGSEFRCANAAQKTQMYITTTNMNKDKYILDQFILNFFLSLY